jgi:hypothetical protein
MPTGKTPETGADPCRRIMRRLRQPLGSGAMPNEGI